MAGIAVCGHPRKGRARRWLADRERPRPPLNPNPARPGHPGVRAHAAGLPISPCPGLSDPRGGTGRVNLAKLMKINGFLCDKAAAGGCVNGGFYPFTWEKFPIKCRYSNKAGRVSAKKNKEGGHGLLLVG